MSCYFYHTDLGQNAVFHNFALHVALIQCLGRSKHALALRGLLAKPLKKFPKSPIRLARGFSLLTSAKVYCLN